MTTPKRAGQPLQAQLNDLDSRKAIRAALGAGENERTVDAVRRVIAERDKLRLELADVGKGLAAAWETIAAREEYADAN